MYLFYLDESGDPSGWNDNDNFVLAGVAVHEGQVRNLSKKLDQLQLRFFPEIRPPLEFHAYHIRTGKGRFRHMTPEDRSAFLNSAYDVIATERFPNLVAFVTAIHVSAVESPQQAFEDCLEDICQRFNTFLVRQFKAGFRDKGLLIMDRSGRDMMVRESMARFEREGTRHGYLGNIMDVPYFADSKHTRMIQLADLLAHAAGRYFNAGDDTYMTRLLDRLDRVTGTGRRVGFKHIVARGFDCPCIALH